VTVDGSTYKGRRLPLDRPAPSRRVRGPDQTAPSEIIAGLINGDQAAQATEKYKSYTQLMKWCAAAKPSCPSAPTPTRPSRRRTPVAFGAVGIGLTSTEHMFFEGDRIDAMREMILADSLPAREARPRQTPPLPAR